MKKENITEGYSFNKSKHIHQFNGKSLTGVTTVLAIISKGDGLIQWSANMAVEWLKEFPTDFEGAKKAWVKKRNSAGTKGVDTHAVIEGLIKEAIEEGAGYLSVDSVYEQSHQLDYFVKWAIDNKVKFLASEMNVWSLKLYIGGIVDFVFEIDGEVYVGDLKTAKSIYPANYWQVSAYQYCLQEMGLFPKVKGFKIVRLGKDEEQKDGSIKKGTCEVGSNYSYADNIEGFESALVVYRKLNLIS